MHFRKRTALATALLFALFGTPGSAATVDYLDHYEFEASLAAPYSAKTDHTREFGLDFRLSGAEDGTLVAWRLEILNKGGLVLRSFRGESPMLDSRAQASVHWDERDGRNGPLPWGQYEARLTAVPMDRATQDVLGLMPQRQRIDSALEALSLEGEVQSFDIEVGSPAHPAMPDFAPLRTNDRTAHPTTAGAHLSAPATGGLPYTVYYGNLHSQTNHSDGGGPLSSCVSEQAPQAGTGGPAQAYQYALNEGLDFLMTSEHNHMFDGSTSTNASGNPTTAKKLFASGLSAATTFNSAHSNFLGVYGLEWGVISNGGHMNLFNVDKLLSWEYNSSNQLYGDIFTTKSDYPAMYTLMKSHNWIGQFNHPATSGQFAASGTALGYTADGEAVMVQAEVTNSSAFSSNTTDTETGRSSFEGAWKILLERGYHVAPSSDQDNHCANWGASYTHRTGVLIPSGTALSFTSFLDALRARRVFATEDKAGQIVLTANGHVMGERFGNTGPLTLTVKYASTSGDSAQRVQVFQGVPGSNGTVTS